MLFRHIIILCVAMAMLAACQQEAPDAVPQDSPLVATLGDLEIHESDIDRELDLLPESLGNLRDHPDVRRKVLQNMLRQYALSRKAVAMELDLDPLIRRKIQQARDDILIDELKRRRMRSMPMPDDAAITAYYAAHKQRYAIPEMIHIRHIVVADRQTADMILARLQRKADDFVALAARYSIDEHTRQHGGDLNWFPRGTLDANLEAVAFALDKTHTLSKPVKTRFGWHILQWLGKKEHVLPPLENVRDQVIADIRNEQWNSWVSEQLKQQRINIISPDYAS